ncbi:MAG: hypothetical protein EOP11_05935 [Proteobacteria bacterium]|nr:MAG: hypothetical protein EOP11_05935 [Pseudomonadota bacterium]
MRLIPLWLLVFGLYLSLGTDAAQAAAPSGLKWFTLITPHFHVHHTAPLETYARHIAGSLERALPILEQDLKWPAPLPLDVVVMDASDNANGFAANFPNTHIELYAVPFESDSVLTHYVDWANEISVHELTHIIANDGGTGAYRTLRSIFGSWVKPNGLQPVWLIEGLAVYAESKNTPGGRGRSPWLEALLREAVKQNKLNDPSYTSIDRFNDGNAWWPGGNSAYLLGYTIQALGTREKSDLPGAVSLNNAGHFPFLPNNNLEAVLGKNWGDIWAAASERIATRYAGAPAAAEPCYLTDSGRATGGQALSPDGWIYYSDEDFQNGIHLARVKANAPCGSAKPERLYHKWYGGPAQVAVNETGTRVAFAQYTNQRFERFFSDIHLYDPQSGKTQQITQGARARDPAFSQGSLFYISQREDSTQAILQRNLQDGSEKILFTSRPLERLSGLTARDEQLAFSLHDNQGHEKIYLLSTVGGDPKPLTALATGHREFERNPFIRPDGTVLYAYAIADRQEIRSASIKTGASKIVAYGSAGLLDRPIALNENEILVQAYSLGGMNLARLPLEKNIEEAPHQAIDLHEHLSGEKAPPLSAGIGASNEYPPSVPYDALHTPATSLWPQYWLPEAAVEASGLLIGASTTGNDPLEYHRYGLLLQYDTRARFPRYRAFYDNRIETTRFHFEANQFNNYFSSTKTSNRQAVYSGEAIVPLGGFSSFSFGAAFQERTLFRSATHSAAIFQNFRYEQTGKRPAAMAPNFGSSLRAYLGLHPNTKGENFFLDFRPEAATYFRGFSPTHSIGIVARAGLSTNKLLASNYYQGGGLTILNDNQFVVRGYPLDALLGQRIATLNTSYTMPIAWPFRGIGVHPAFLESLGLKFLADIGSANFLADYEAAGLRFYRPAHLFDQTLVGVGAEILGRGTLFYHVPVSASLGLHYGPMKQFGGGLNFFLGINLGILGFNGAPPIDH